MSSYSPLPVISTDLGDVFWLGASYEDNGYNYNAVQSLAPPTVTSGSWAFQVCNFLNQGTISNAYRWASGGGVAGKLGKIYAVSGSSWGSYITSVNTSITTQCAKVIADYPGGFPSGSVVVIHCGINEMQSGGVLVGGGIFSADGTTVTWAQAGFTMPAGPAGTVSVTVTSSAQCVAGANNIVLINNSYLMTVSSIIDGTHIQLTNTFSNATGTIPSGTMEAYSAAVIGGNITQAATGISNLLAAGASQVIFTICPNVGQLPNFASVAALATTTWNYWKAQAKASLYPNTAMQVSVFDMSVVTNNMINSPTAYGLKDSTTQWNSSVTINQNDLMWYDGFHQNAPSHVEIASQFLATIKRRAYLSLY
jgi:hypothetical protein